MSSKLTGVVKLYSEKKGFGVIKQDNSSNEFLFHKRNIIGSVADHHKVRFVTIQTPKGVAASDVERI